jgi:ribosomal protein S18 acetylase RimI-like enzyme
VSRELRRLTLPIPSALEETLERFDCCGERHAEDEVAREVMAYLTEGQYLMGLEQDITSAYLYLETDESPPLLVGYVAVALGVVKLSASEKQTIGEPPFSDFGAVRLVMIGIDVDQEGRGYGDELLDAVVGLARRVRETISVRFLVADANRNLQAWYEQHHFEGNRSPKENEPDSSGTTLSMRLDLRSRHES